MNRPTIIAVLLIAAPACTNRTHQTSADSPSLPASAVAQIEALLSEKEARTPAQRKISSHLLYLANGMPTGGGLTKAPGLVRTSQSDAADRILVDLKADVTPELLDKVRALGGEVLNAAPAHRSARAWMHPGALEALAAETAVQSIRPALEVTTRRIDPPRGGAKFQTTSREERVKRATAAALATLGAPRTTLALAPAATEAGSVTSQGSRAHGADRARKYFGTAGSGIRVGVLSDSDDFKEQSIASGDLGADTVTLPGQDGRPGSGEGTAMMEIVHDLAPGAQLFFATAFASPESFADNIRALRFTYHCDVIVDDVVYYFEAPYQDDIIAQAVDDVTTDGALYFSSAGNEGNYDDGTSGTWEGDFRSGGTLATLPSGYTVHDFGGGVISNRVEVSGGPLVLHWADPGSLDSPASGNDYDLFVLDHDLRNVLVASTDIQDGTGLAFEFLGFILPPDVRVVVARKSGASTRAMRVGLFGGELALATPGATYGHAAVAAAFAVGAVDAAEAGGGEFTGGPTTPVELYSSDGNRRVFYDRTNRLIARGATFASEGGVLRRKPDLSAADGVSTTLPSATGLNPFFGTSAAAPHAGAIGALLRSAVPRATPAQLRRALLSGSIDIEARGADADSGAGVVSAFNSLLALGAPPAVFLELGTVAATPASGTVLLPGGSGTLSAPLFNSGGATAGALRGTLTSTSPYATVTQGSALYGDLAAGAGSASLTPFAFTISPTAPCGAKLTFSLSATFTGRGTSPTLFALGLPTGRPGTAVATTSYTGPPVAIPDGDAAGVDVPLDLSSGRIAGLTFTVDGSACTTTAGATTVGFDHTWVGDLIVRLTSPAGTSVPLMVRPGGLLNSGNNFCQTVLDDGAATSIQDILVAGAPWTGTFRPASPLAAFVGEDSSGTWILSVSDNASFDTGSVRAFSVSVRGFDCSP
jgi:subtilisin-like proprotein convertase family protein